MKADRGADALLAAAVLAIDPAALGGVRLRAQAGPVRDAWLLALRSLMQADASAAVAAQDARLAASAEPRDPEQPAAMPWRRLPQHASDDRLLGGIDLPATLATGRPVLQQGVLAAVDGGCLLVAMAERLSATTAAHLCAALDQGAVRIEREGITALMPTRFAVVALDEALPDDTPLSPALADRLALWLDLSTLSRRELSPPEQDWVQAVSHARRLWPAVTVGDDILQALCSATLALGVDAPRAAWWAVQVARASAALFGRRAAEADDAALAARLVLGPRATCQPVQPEPETQEQPNEGKTDDQDPDDRSPPPDAASNAEPPDLPPPPADDAPDEARLQDLSELEARVVDAATAAIPAGLLARLASGETARDRSASAGRAGAARASRQRGRPLGARRGAPQGGARLHLIATLRAAAPWQTLRRLQQPQSAARVQVRADDFHVRRFEQRSTTTTLFAVDASGSSALYRLAEAKGAVELLLAECYVRRDQVAVLTFRGQGAELLLPPTRSLVRAKRALAGMPGGGGTPLAAGIDAVAQLADQVRRSGSTPVVVVLTDGRANVSRSGQGGRVQAAADALAAARALRAQGGHVLLVDTSVRPEPAALALAVAMGARYLALPQADARLLSRAIEGRSGGRGAAADRSRRD